MGKIAGVVGRPIFHSLSPEIHRAALREARISGGYLRLAVEGMPEAFQVMQEMSLVGVNVTAPFKEEAYRSLVHLSENARSSNSVNTISYSNLYSNELTEDTAPHETRCFGDNTDCFGIAESLRSTGVSVGGAPAVVLGAGGAARSAVQALQTLGARVSILNRTARKAELLALEFGVSGSDLSFNSQSQHVRSATVIVNCTSTEERFIATELLHRGQTLLESQYRTETALAHDLKALGGQVIEGTEWLVHQAAESFSLFFGRRVGTEVFRRGLLDIQPKRGKPLVVGGLMGAGKTMVGRALAERFGTEWIDIDSWIESQEGRTVAQIFANDGEARFRVLEELALESALSRNNVVISTGGGVVLSERNRSCLARESIFVWLWASPRALLSRLEGDTTRPLLYDVSDKLEREERLTFLLADRFNLYADCSDMVVPTEGHSIEAIAERIAYESDFAR